MRADPGFRSSLTAALLVSLWLLAPCAFAQALFEQFNFQFAFSTPGARAKGMGQAFTAIGNDASAAETSPGGLALSVSGAQKSEAMFELSAPRTFTARAAAEDAFSTRQFETFGDRVYVPSFLGAVFRPSALRERGLALTAYYHDFLTYQESFELQRRAVPGTSVYFLPTAGESSLSGSSIGIGFGCRLGGRLGLGVTSKLDRLSVKTFTTRRDIFNPDLIVNIQQIDDHDWSFGFVVGGVFAPIANRPSARLGVSYSYNPRFSLSETFDTVVEGQRSAVAGYPRELTISVPDRLSLGIAEILGPLTAAVDVVLDRYSELSGSATTLLPEIGQVPRTAFSIRDVWSVHAGLDWNVKPRTHVLAGVFTAPTHAYRYDGPTDTAGGIALDYAFNSRAETTDVGWSLGLQQGLKFGDSERIRATLAWNDTPGQSNEFVISLILVH